MREKKFPAAANLPSPNGRNRPRMWPKKPHGDANSRPRVPFPEQNRAVQLCDMKSSFPSNSIVQLMGMGRMAREIVNSSLSPLRIS